MIQVKQWDAKEFFSELDDAGWMHYPNRYSCVQCGYGVVFNTGALARASAYRWKGTSRASKLKGNFVGVFDEVETEFCREDQERLTLNIYFTLDFHCPKCTLATCIGFEKVEVRMDAYVYRPLRVWTVKK